MRIYLPGPFSVSTREIGREWESFWSMFWLMTLLLLLGAAIVLYLAVRGGYKLTVWIIHKVRARRDAAATRAAERPEPAQVVSAPARAQAELVAVAPAPTSVVVVSVEMQPVQAQPPLQPLRPEPRPRLSKVDALRHRALTLGPAAFVLGVVAFGLAVVATVLFAIGLANQPDMVWLVGLGVVDAAVLAWPFAILTVVFAGVSLSAARRSGLAPVRPYSLPLGIASLVLPVIWFFGSAIVVGAVNAAHGS